MEKGTIITDAASCICQRRSRLRQNAPQSCRFTLLASEKPLNKLTYVFPGMVNIKRTQKYSVVVIRRGAMAHLESSTRLITKIKRSR